MNSTLVIARRELTERRFVFVAAAILATLPFVLAATPQAKAWGPMHVIAVVGGFAAVGFMFALPIALGSSIVSRELVEKRMSFYFARPVSAGAIWFGKVLASLFTIVACLAIILTPAALFAHRAWQTGWSIPVSGAVLTLSISATSLFFLSHAVSTMLRSRSKWLVLDIILAVAVAYALWTIFVPFLETMAMELLAVMAAIVSTALLVILATAGWWQLAHGRIDRVRNHVELSKYVWLSLGGVVLALTLFAWWVRSASPSDLTAEIHGVQQRHGSWVMLGGQSRGRLDYEPAFLYDTVTEKYTRLGAALYGHSFSRDGRAVVWNEPMGIDRNTLAVMMRRLDQPDAKPVDTGIRTRRMSSMSLSDDASRLAVVEASGILGVYDLATGASLGAAKVPMQSSGGRSVFFVNPGLIRMYLRPLKAQPGDLRTVQIVEYDVATRRMAVTGAFPTLARYQAYSATADGSLVVVRNGGAADPARRVEVLDGHTGALVAALPMPAGAEAASVSFVEGNRIALVQQTGRELTLRLFGADAKPLHDIPLGAMYWAYPEIGLGGGKLLVSVARKGSPTGGGMDWKAVIVDLSRGTIEHEEQDLRPDLLGFYAWNRDPRVNLAAPAQAFAFTNAKGDVVRWNPATGEKKTLISM